MAWTRIMAFSLAEALFLVSGLQTRAEAALEENRTAITGTVGSDVIDSGLPLDVNAVLETTSDEDVTTTATAIDGLAGHDQITSTAAITATASSRIDAPYVPVRLSGTSSKSYSYGLRGGEASDVLMNLASILSTSSAYTKIVEVIMQIDLGVVGWPTSSTAYATGIEGGNIPDLIQNDGAVTVTATSETLVKEARISAVEIPLDQSAFGDGKTTAAATAIGITGDLLTGTPSLTLLVAEVISNRGTLSVTANATSTTEQGMVELVGAARVDASTTAEAYSAGILGGVNDNLITNHRTIRSEAVSSANMTSVELKMKGFMLKSGLDLFGLDVGTFETAADSVAVGMAGGPGEDTLINKGTDGSGLIEAHAKAEADSEIYTFSIAPPLGGGGGGKQSAVALTAGGLSLEDLSASTAAGETSSAYGDAGTRATSSAVGILGGAGDDALTNQVALISQAESTASNLTLSVDVALDKTSYIPLPGAAVADASATAIASSSGLDGGAGNDTIENESTVNASATAEADSLGIAATLKGSVEGLAAGVSVVDSASTAVSAAKGITGGGGGDTITNAGIVTSSATSRDDSTSVSVTVAGDKIGIAAGVTLADAVTRAASTSLGIDSGDAGGDGGAGPASEGDVITNTGDVRSTADSTAHADAVGVSVAASLNGISVSVALAETDVMSEAYATGIRGGTGEDTIENNGPGAIRAASTARGSSNSVSVAVSGAWAGVAMGASFADANTLAASGAVGIEAGGSNDVITNDAEIAATSTAEASSNSIAVTASVAVKGFSAGVAMSNTQTGSGAAATGIDAGDGDDAVDNTSLISTSASATTKTKTITVDFSEAGAALADVSSKAQAEATGLEGGQGTDELTNSGTVVTTAASVSDDTSAVANLSGYARGDLTSTSTATAIGLHGGDTAQGQAGGDTLINDMGGSIVATSAANAYAENYVVQGGGVEFAKVGSITDSRATAMAGGKLGDVMENDGSMTSVARSEIRASNFSFELFGVQLGSVGINATGTAIGMDGGSGGNTLTNKANGQIHTYADLTTTALNTEASIGAQFVHSGVTADAISIGLLTGQDGDVIENQGTINATANSLGQAGGGSIGLISMSLVNALASADIKGIDSGGGDDVVLNEGVLTAGAIQSGDSFLVKADTTAVSFDFISFVSSSLGASAQVAGIEGGAGHDTIVNSGTIRIGDEDADDSCTGSRSMVIGRSFGFGGQFLGMAFAYAGSSARISSFGINGGAGDDLLTNSGDVLVKARSYADVDCETFIPLGLVSSLAQAESISSAQATGLYGGDGRDWIENRGTVTADAWTVSDAATDAEVDVFADPHAESEARAAASAAGIDGGSGGDKVLSNLGRINAVANAGARPYAFSESDTMRAHGEGYGLAESTASGITSGDAGNTVANHETGVISVQALAGTTDSLGNIGTIDSDDDASIDAGYYNAGTGQWTPLSAGGFGIRLGSGPDTVVNDGTIDVSSGANGSVYARTYTWTRYPFSTARSVVLGEATGITAGRGSNDVTNNGRVTVEALSYAAPKVYSWSRDYQATANAYGVSQALALGIEADGTITNSFQGVLDVTARATSWANAPTNSEYATATALLTATATGLASFSDTGLTGLQRITQDGTATIKALAGEDTNGKSQQIAWVNTNITSRDSTATCTGTSTVDATGIRAGDGLKEITNSGTLTVLGRARADLTTAGGAHTYARSYYYNPEAKSYATGIATATGILAAGGENHVWNLGTMDVQAVTQDVYAWSDSYSSWSTCYSTAEALGQATAKGLSTGAGDDEILQRGSLTVASSANAKAYAYADTRDNNLADEHETSRATAEVVSIGIDGGAGHNTIENEGDLQVRAAALAQVYAGGGHASVTATTRSMASAVGISAGDDGSFVRNSGTIDVRARADYIHGSPTLEVHSVGIRSGSGDDTIINEGAIATSMSSGVWVDTDSPANAVAGIGIDSGAGSDVVILYGGSGIKGSIDLGADDDTLVLRGSPVVHGSITTGGGEDGLVLDGSGAFDHRLSGFTSAVKLGDGRYTISGLNPVSFLEVTEGVLQVNQDYQFSLSGLFTTIASVDGEHGQLKIMGMGNLAGTLTVERTQGLYRQAMTYDLITADTLTGGFQEVLLPDVPLLAFSMEQTTDRVQVSVTPRSFTSAATNPVERWIGAYLDRNVAQATGGLYDMLGTFQGLSADEFSTAFAGLSPGSYDSATRTTYVAGRQYTRTLVKRLHSIRKRFDAQMDDPCAYGLWYDTFGQRGDHRGEEGFTGYDYRLYGVTAGLDRTFDGRFLLGIGLGYSDTDIDLDRDQGGGDIETVTGSLYGSWFTERGYVDAALAYGSQGYENDRHIAIGSLRGTAHSDHQGDTVSAFVEGGMNWDLRPWVLQPFASLAYACLNEEGFSESGAGDINQTVRARDTGSLVSELGLRLTRVFHFNKGILIPEASLGWNYDFDIGDRVITASLEGSPNTSFSIEGQEAGRHGATLGAAMTFLSTGGLSASLRYGGEFRRHERAHSLIAELRIEF